MDSRLPEFIDKVNSNFYSKLTADEYNSCLPELEDMLDQMYTIPDYYFYLKEEEIDVNLESYNTHYSKEGFELFQANYSERHSLEDVEILSIQK